MVSGEGVWELFSTIFFYNGSWQLSRLVLMSNRGDPF